MTINDIAKIVANDVIEINNSASIPATAYTSIAIKAKRLIEKGTDLRKYPKSKRTSGTYKEALSNFSRLFDVCPCKGVDEQDLSREKITNAL